MSIEYLNNKVFEELITVYNRAKRYKKRNPARFDLAQASLAQAFYLLSENIIRAFKFQMIDEDDMLQEGVMICFEKSGRFNPEYRGASGNKSKAFNYFTEFWCIN